jgi:hypothetical protein
VETGCRGGQGSPRAVAQSGKKEEYEMYYLLKPPDNRKKVEMRNGKRL